jgi:hypothetical protein
MRSENSIMRTILGTLCLMSALVAPGTLPAAEDDLAAARAKVIAPFLDEETILVVRIDASRLSVDPILTMVVDWIPQAKEGNIQKAAVLAREALPAFTRAGGREFYLVVSLADISLMTPHRFSPLVIVPLAPGADEKAVAAVLGPAGCEVHQRIGDVLFAGSRSALERIKQGRPDARPELARAFAAAGDRALQILLLPPSYSRRVIEEMMPELPKIVGGGPSTVLTRGLLWAAVGINPPPRGSLRLVIQSRDHEVAVALRAKWDALWELIRQDTEVRNHMLKIDDLSKQLIPTIEGDRLLLDLDETQRLPPRRPEAPR